MQKPFFITVVSSRGAPYIYLNSPSYVVKLPLGQSNWRFSLSPLGCFFTQWAGYSNWPSALMSTLVMSYRSLMFVGKGYKLVTGNSNFLTFNFGHSHLIVVYFPYSTFKKHAKTKLSVYGLNSALLETRVSTFFQFKPLNIFTWRGLRVKSWPKRKKVGKVSLYF